MAETDSRHCINYLGGQDPPSGLMLLFFLSPLPPWEPQELMFNLSVSPAALVENSVLIARAVYLVSASILIRKALSPARLSLSLHSSERPCVIYAFLSAQMLLPWSSETCHLLIFCLASFSAPPPLATGLSSPEMLLSTHFLLTVSRAELVFSPQHITPCVFITMM